jgi:hypothetical protein
MSRPRKDFPSYRQHRSGQTYVTISDPSGKRKDILLGECNSFESKLRYDEAITRWIANGRTLKGFFDEAESITNNELFLRFLNHAKSKYLPQEN